MLGEIQALQLLHFKRSVASKGMLEPVSSADNHSQIKLNVSRGTCEHVVRLRYRYLVGLRYRYLVGLRSDSDLGQMRPGVLNVDCRRH
jgi:hypothetical protein